MRNTERKGKKQIGRQLHIAKTKSDRKPRTNSNTHCYCSVFHSSRARSLHSLQFSIRNEFWMNLYIVDMAMHFSLRDCSSAVSSFTLFYDKNPSIRGYAIPASKSHNHCKWEERRKKNKTPTTTTTTTTTKTSLCRIQRALKVNLF